MVLCLESHNYASLKIRNGTCDWSKKSLSVGCGARSQRAWKQKKFRTSIRALNRLSDAQVEWRLLSKELIMKKHWYRQNRELPFFGHLRGLRWCQTITTTLNYAQGQIAPRVGRITGMTWSARSWNQQENYSNEITVQHAPNTQHARKTPGRAYLYIWLTICGVERTIASMRAQCAVVGAVKSR